MLIGVRTKLNIFCKEAIIWHNFSNILKFMHVLVIIELNFSKRINGTNGGFMHPSIHVRKQANKQS